MRDFLAFRKMVTPVLIQVYYWVGVLTSVGCGLVRILTGSGVQILAGVALIIVGPLLFRTLCEQFILFFRMNETLTEIKNSLERLQR